MLLARLVEEEIDLDEVARLREKLRRRKGDLS